MNDVNQDWMRFVPDDPVVIEAISSARQERIRELTMKKIAERESDVKRHTRRPLRIALIAACAAILLCGSVFAAQKLGLFDLAGLLGAKDDAAVEITHTYDETMSDVYEGVRYSLETVMTDGHAVYSVVRAEPEQAGAELQEVWLSAMPPYSGSERCDVLEKTPDYWRYLVCYVTSGEEIQPEDELRITVHPSQDESGVPLFSLTLDAQPSEALRWQLKDGKTLSLTAFSLCVTSPYDMAADEALVNASAPKDELQFNRLVASPETVELMFSDGTTLLVDRDFWDCESDLQLPAQTEGFFLSSMTADRTQFYRVGVFAQMLDLSALVRVTVDGETYSVSEAQQ